MVVIYFGPSRQDNAKRHVASARQDRKGVLWFWKMLYMHTYACCIDLHGHNLGRPNVHVILRHDVYIYSCTCTGPDVTLINVSALKLKCTRHYSYSVNLPGDLETHELPHHGAVWGCVYRGCGRGHAALSQNEYLSASGQSLVLGQTSLCHATDTTFSIAGEKGLWTSRKWMSLDRCCGAGSVCGGRGSSSPMLFLPRSCYWRLTRIPSPDTLPTLGAHMRQIGRQNRTK